MPIYIDQRILRYDKSLLKKCNVHTMIRDRMLYKGLAS